MFTNDKLRRPPAEADRSGPVDQDDSANFVRELATTLPMKEVASLKAASDVYDANVKGVPQAGHVPDVRAIKRVRHSKG